MKKLISMTLAFFVLVLAGCTASVPMSSGAENIQAKQFNLPPEGKSGIYIYRDSNFGAGLKKAIYIDGKLIGESAPKVFFYKQVDQGAHTISTESEFSDNKLNIVTEGNKNYFVRQYIKVGVFVGGANLEIVDEEKAKNTILKLDLAK